MYNLISRLLIYRNIPEGSILYSLAENIEKVNRYDGRELDSLKKEEIISSVYTQINKLLDLAARYGFHHNLWHSYLAYLLAFHENPFSLTCERAENAEGTLNQFAREDFKILKKLFDYDFTPVEKALGINCFQMIRNFKGEERKGRQFNKNIGEKVRFLSSRIEKACDEEEIFKIVTEFYRLYGVGKFGLNKAFRIKQEDGKVNICPISNTEDICLNDLVGYELQKKKLIENTEAFISGRKANNVLLYGDSGTGKSTSIKALLNEYYDKGLRMIEIYKHQIADLPSVIAQVKDRNYKFIIYMDDLSFEEFESEYKYLKAVIEGGLEAKPDNILIYATSNRRHLIRETWADRTESAKDELHRTDTMQEKLSLVARFGITINYSAPNQQEFFEIVKALAKRTDGITLSEEELCARANIWEMNHGGRSGRTAQQFINYLAGVQKDHSD
ncbi:MAG: hypothetical protein ACFWTJ_12120 [Lachnoclostridium sp.]|jgi:uncharacterized protein